MNGGSDPMVGVSLPELLILVIIFSAIWVYFDAKRIGVRKGLVSALADMGPGAWALSTLLLWIIAFPMYLAKRGEFQSINSRQANKSSRQCPFCAEEIQEAAVFCKHCHRDLK
jgi:hypothetical protein